MKTNKKIAKKTFQHGDVLGVKLSEMPSGEQKIISKYHCVLAEGEFSGHAHVVDDDEAELIEVGGKMLLTLQKSATLKHQEHKPITLEAGIWQIGRVNEYDYFNKMVKKVQD